MSNPSPRWHDLDQLLDRVLDGLHGEEDARQLNEILRTDMEACRRYVAYVELHGRLTWGDGIRAGSVQGTSGEELVDDGREAAGFSAMDLPVGAAVDLPHQLDPEPRIPSPESPALPFPSLSPLPSSLSPTFVGGPVFSYLTAVVILGLMLLGAWAYEITHYQPQFVETPSPMVPSRDRPELVFVGRITGLKDCRWSDPRTEAYAGASVPLGRKYALSFGLMEITYKTGAKVILEGPCTYIVESPVGGFLALGKLTARIEERREKREERAKSQAANHNPPSPLSPLPTPLFSVRTPTAIITDLGTEFGVEVSKEGNTISYVFRGSVRVQVVGAAGKSIVLRANESAQVVSDGADGPRLVIDVVKEKLPKFVQNMPLPESLNESNAYAELVLSMQPVVYYRMEGAKDLNHRNLVVDAAEGNHHGRMLSDSSSGPPYASGRWGKSLYFRGPAIGDAVIVDDFPKTANDRLTVSAWVMAKRWVDSWPQIVGNWGRKPGQFHLGLFGTDYDLAVKVAQRDGELLLVREENTRFPLGLWQHVAFVIDGTELRLYRNGDEVAAAMCRGLQPNPLMKSLAIGCKTTDSGDAVVGNRWHGLIDELAIFNEALSPVAIRRLYEGKPSLARVPLENLKEDGPME